MDIFKLGIFDRMPCNSLVLFAVFVALVSPTIAGVMPEVVLGGDGQLLSVSFALGNRRCKYKLVATSNFALDAKITKYTQQGAEQQLPPTSRTFTSRKAGMSATAILDSSDASRLGVSGLFVCEDVLIDIPTSHHGIPTNDSIMELHVHPFNGIHNSGPAHPRGIREGRRLVGTVFSKEGYEIANETDDWKLPPEISANVWSTRSTWNGVRWYPGCYSGDNQMHVFKLGIVADVAAYRKHGSALNDLIESTIAKTSFIYESQFNIKLEISELQIYTSASSAPSYASDECPDINTQLDRLTAEARLSGGAVHLLTGCGQGFGVVGLAYLGSICSRSNTGVNQLHNSMSWITFAHELGHNYGGSHSFEEGSGTTGGIMDYGDGRLNGEYQFNTKYRKNEMCQTMNGRVNRCGGNFDAVSLTPPPTLPPTLPPTPPPTLPPTLPPTPPPTLPPTLPPTPPPTLPPTLPPTPPPTPLSAAPTPPPGGECVDTLSWTNGGGHACAVYEKDWCKDGSFRGIGVFHNHPDRNCCACGKGRLRDDLLSGAIITAPARLIPLLAFGLLLSPLY